MRFSFTGDQIVLRDAVRDLLTRECSPDVVRAAWPEPDADGQGPGAGARAPIASLDSLWQHLVDAGLPALLVPEDAGGLGEDEVATMAVLEECGYAAVPHPVVETVCVVAPLLAAAGRSEELEAVLGGQQVAVASPTQDLVIGPLGSERALALRLDRFSVGSASFVEIGGGSAPDLTIDGSLHLRTGDFTSAYEVELPAGAVELAFNRAALGTAAQLIGLSRHMLDLTLSYVKDRKQFGVPIGSFQAVKHHLADARLQIEFAGPAVSRAAWSLATNAPSASRDVSMAKAMATDCAHLVGRKALQCHGGIGYTVEYDLHLFMKRAWALERLWGDAWWHRDRVGRSIGV